MKKVLTMGALALLAVPSVAQAQPGPSPNANDRARAVKVCKNVNAAIGSRAFRATFAPRTMSARAAMRNCARKQAAAEVQNRQNAAQQCREERGTTQESREAFARKYGTERANFRNAFGRCVSQHAREESKEDEQRMINAAQQCKAERADPNFAAEHGGKTFAQFYGTERSNFRNAFGKCVSQKAREQNDD